MLPIFIVECYFVAPTCYHDRRQLAKNDNFSYNFWCFRFSRNSGETSLDFKFVGTEFRLKEMFKVNNKMFFLMKCLSISLFYGRSWFLVSLRSLITAINDVQEWDQSCLLTKVWRFDELIWIVNTSKYFTLTPCWAHRVSNRFENAFKSINQPSVCF